jgi:two-component system nitrate/nitrite response regulator NarL
VRVLIVDDEPDVRLLLRAQMESNSHEVTGEAADGAEALERCGEVEPDVVILDLLMPRVNGFDTIPRMRREFPNVGVIAYTAVAGDFVRNEMSRWHIPLVLKTANFRPIAAALEQALAQRTPSTDPV